MHLSQEFIKHREEILEQGRQEGLQEAVREGAVCLVLRLLARQIGKLSPEAQSQIQSLSLPQIESLAYALLDFSQPSDLQDWLRSHS
jgi:flagellar biosynthesis/type III secretory pathway protein FliH